MKYAHERAWTACNKLATVSLTASNLGQYAPAPLYCLEFRAVIPEWSACIKVKGCDWSETISRLCVSTSGCQACTAAQQAHAGAAQVEQDMARWAMDAWMAIRPDSGGVRHTSVRQASPGAPLELVVTLHVPGVAVAVSPGAKITVGARAQRRSFLALQPPEVAKLQADWVEFVTRCYGAPAAGLDCSAPLEWLDIWASFRRTHAPAMHAWNQMLADLPLDVVVPPDVTATFARAGSLGIYGANGRARKVQRTSWFGIFGGRHQLEVMGALDIYPAKQEPTARVEVVDAVRVLHMGPVHASLQSVRTAAVYAVPTEIVHLRDTVDSLGRPTHDTTETRYEYWAQSRMRLKAQIHAEQVKLTRDAGGVQIADQITLQSALTSRQTKGSRRDEYAAKYKA